MTPRMSKKRLKKSELRNNVKNKVSVRAIYSVLLMSSINVGPITVILKVCIHIF